MPAWLAWIHHAARPQLLARLQSQQHGVALSESYSQAFLEAWPLQPATPVAIAMACTQRHSDATCLHLGGLRRGKHGARHRGSSGRGGAAAQHLRRVGQQGVGGKLGWAAAEAIRSRHK